MIDDGKLKEQGHVFYFAFYYSKFLSSDDIFKIISLSIRSTSIDTCVLEKGSVYDNVRTLFNPSAIEMKEFQSEHFVNPELREALFKIK
jgi:hypothetical protein